MRDGPPRPGLRPGPGLRIVGSTKSGTRLGLPRTNDGCPSLGPRLTSARQAVTDSMLAIKTGTESTLASLAGKVSVVHAVLLLMVHAVPTRAGVPTRVVRSVRVARGLHSYGRFAPVMNHSGSVQRFHVAWPGH